MVRHQHRRGRGRVSTEGVEAGDQPLTPAESARIDKIVEQTINDTPITMVRNNFVELAREAKCDLLLMVVAPATANAGSAWETRSALYLKRDARLAR